ncbi:helix-turn-helix domain-containing protein [Pseudomonas sp. RIT-To-2]|uniref:helix-turn-helix domain-containing protein n=1 Tax=Pseudomonas sp. RIT-To-2 TaxID=3462541 RepID=UPI002413B89E
MPANLVPLLPSSRLFFTLLQPLEGSTQFEIIHNGILHDVFPKKFPDLAGDSVKQITSSRENGPSRTEEEFAKKSSQPKFRGLAPWQERRAKELIAANLISGITVEAIAGECSYSRCHFSRAFKISTGITPHQYLLNLKIEKAKHLLCEQSARIIDISSECGFSDSSHFTRVFSKLVGYTPSYWRRINNGFNDTIAKPGD